MHVAVDCPFCKMSLPVEIQRVSRGTLLECPLCGREIVVAGRFLSDLFWAANNARHELIL